MLGKVEMDKCQITKSVTYGSKLQTMTEIIGQRHYSHDFELVQNEYLNNLNITGPMDEDNDPYKRWDHRHIQEKTKIDKMGKLKREVEFLERGMQILRTKLQKRILRKRNAES